MTKQKELVKLGEIIRKLRLKAGISQLELAEKSECHLNYIGGIERGTQNPSYLKLVKISKSLNYPVHKFFESLNKPSGNSKEKR
jgi:transcriptional regulator with XRE-family HTH domain